jgi:hypothetical protein
MALPVEPDGAGADPGSFTVIGQYPDLLVQSATRVVNAETIVARENIYGVSFQFTIPMTEYMGEGPQAAAGLRAGWIQAMAQHQHVIGMAYTQDVNASGTLVDQMIITVGTPDGEQSADLTIPLSALNAPSSFQKVDDLYAIVARTAGIAA